ncbi:MAG: STAS-like domain-containing protein [Brumimicrobium sp.]
MTRLIVKDIINSELAVSTEKGDLVFNELNSKLENNEQVIIDFKGVDLIITAFLNAAIGKLYSKNKYTADFLNDHIKLENIQKEDISLFKDVIIRAKEYFENKDKFENDVNDMIYGKD